MMVNNIMWNINLDVLSYFPLLLMTYAYIFSTYILKLYLKIGTGVEHNDSQSFETIQEDSGDNFHLIKSATPSKDYCMLIGPEGDFSSSEINESQDFGFKPVSLGDNRLRTETAGLAACHILNLLNEKQ